MKHRLALLPLFVGTVLFAASAGCGESVSPELVKFRQSLLLDSPPDMPLSIADGKETLDSDDDTATELLTLIGSIEAGEFDPFDADQAAFLLSELPDESHGGESHDASNCPFCKRKAAAATRAYVVLHDESDSPIAIPATKLLGVKKGDHVIVQGVGRWDQAVNTINMVATKIHVVR